MGSWSALGSGFSGFFEFVGFVELVMVRGLGGAARNVNVGQGSLKISDA
jgi:hypothetical protein